MRTAWADAARLWRGGEGGAQTRSFPTPRPDLPIPVHHMNCSLLPFHFNNEKDKLLPRHSNGTASTNPSTRICDLKGTATMILRPLCSLGSMHK